MKGQVRTRKGVRKSELIWAINEKSLREEGSMRESERVGRKHRARERKV